MLINDIRKMDEFDNNGDIYFENAKGNTIKLGTFEFDPKYGNATINLENVVKIECEVYHSNTMMGHLPYMYWFKSQYVCDRYHGTPYDDRKWVLDLFKDVTPYTDEINQLIITMIHKFFDYF